MEARTGRQALRQTGTNLEQRPPWPLSRMKASQRVTLKVVLGPCRELCFKDSTWCLACASLGLLLEMLHLQLLMPKACAPTCTYLY